MTIAQYQRNTEEYCGIPWNHKVSHGILWFAVVFRGIPRDHTGSLWYHIGINGFVDFNLCVILCLYLILSRKDQHRYGQSKIQDIIHSKLGLIQQATWSDTGGITKFSAKENFRKILKVSHFPLGFSLAEKYDKIKTSHRVSSESSHPIGFHQYFQDVSPKSLTKLYENV